MLGVHDDLLAHARQAQERSRYEGFQQAALRSWKSLLNCTCSSNLNAGCQSMVFFKVLFLITGPLEKSSSCFNLPEPPSHLCESDPVAAFQPDP